MHDSYSVLKSKELLDGTISVIRFDDLNIHKLNHVTFLISISTETTMMSEELVDAAIIVAIFSKRKNTERKRKRGTVWVKPWLYKRPNFVVYDTLPSELRHEDGNEFRRLFIFVSTSATNKEINLIASLLYFLEIEMVSPSFNMYLDEKEKIFFTFLTTHSK